MYNYSIYADSDVESKGGASCITQYPRRPRGLVVPVGSELWLLVCVSLCKIKGLLGGRFMSDRGFHLKCHLKTNLTFSVIYKDVFSK